MERTLKYWAGAAFALTLSTCSKDTPAAQCIDDDPGCGVACNATHPCAAGLFCGSDALCSKSCTADRGCSSNQQCGEDGQCKAGQGPQAGSTPMQPSGGSGGSSFDNPGMISDAGDKTDASHMPPGACQSADVSATRVIPTVVFVIDQSKSMDDSFGMMGGTRWTVLRDFLLKTDGLIASLEKQISFGLAMYSANSDAGNNSPTCPLVADVKPMIMNYEAIKTLYSGAKPIGDTPTGDAIDKIVAGLPKPAPDQEVSPTVLILATDGEPDRCEELNPQNGQMEAIASVEKAFQAGIRTFIISVGDEVSVQHQQDVANAGIGHKAGDPNAPYWTAGDDASLRDALTEIISGQVSREVNLKGQVQGGDACEGEVTFNGVKLDCKGSDGWELVDPDHIRLLGKACNDFKTQKTAVVHATFPCTVDVVF